MVCTQQTTGLPNPMTRYKASLIHLAISATVIGALTVAVLWRWYPPGLLEMARAGRLLATLAAVDLVMGPLLTLVVFKPGKKSLRFDLTVIALLQAAALFYGLHAAWQSRPVFLVANVDRFDLVYANEVNREDLALAREEFRTLPALGPKVVGAIIPSDPDARTRVLDASLAGRDLQYLPEYYVPYEAAWPIVSARAIPAGDVLERLPAEDRAALERVVARSGQPQENLIVLPIGSSRGAAAMLVRRDDPDVRIPAPVNVWPVFNAAAEN